MVWILIIFTVNFSIELYLITVIINLFRHAKAIHSKQEEFYTYICIIHEFNSNNNNTKTVVIAQMPSRLLHYGQCYTHPGSYDPEMG